MVAQGDEIVGVQARVIEHLRGERPLAPIGALEALLQLDSEDLLEDVGQARPLPAEGAGGDVGVE